MVFLCCVNFEAGEVLSILILADFGIIFFRSYFWLKNMLVLQLYRSSSGFGIDGSVLDWRLQFLSKALYYIAHTTIAYSA